LAGLALREEGLRTGADFSDRGCSLPKRQRPTKLRPAGPSEPVRGLGSAWTAYRDAGAGGAIFESRPSTGNLQPTGAGSKTPSSWPLEVEGAAVDVGPSGRSWDAEPPDYFSGKAFRLHDL